MSVGDVVRLKSGGLDMTVREVEGSRVCCQWFDKKEELHERTFTSESLVLASIG